MKHLFALTLLCLSIGNLSAQELTESDTAAENLGKDVLKYITTGDQEILNLYVTVDDLNRFIDLLPYSDEKKETEKKSILGNYNLNYQKYQRDCDNLIFYFGPNPKYEYTYSYDNVQIEYDVLEYGSKNTAVIVLNFKENFKKHSTDLFIELFVIRTKAGWKIYTIGNYSN